MNEKRRVLILVVIAIVLAVTAVTLHFSDSDVPTERFDRGGDSSSSSGIVGLVIHETADIEDRGNIVGGLG